MDDIELPPSVHCPPGRLRTDVEIRLGKRLAELIDPRRGEDDYEVDIVGESGLAIQNCSDGTGHEIAQAEALQHFDTKPEQLILLHARVSVQLLRSPAASPSQGGLPPGCSRACGAPRRTCRWRCGGARRRSWRAGRVPSPRR